METDNQNRTAIRRKARQRQMLNALEKHFWNVLLASKEIGIARQTHYNWERDDPEYRRALEARFSDAQKEMNRRLSRRIRGDMRRGDRVAMEATTFVYGEAVVKRVLAGEDYEFNLFRHS